MKREDHTVRGAAAIQTMSGTQATITSLGAPGVSDVFGMLGGAILPTYDPLMSSKLHHILVRHEQGAAYVAEGYALVSGKVGCAIVTSGSGATNTSTTIADVNMDSVPMTVISGQVGVSFIETDAFQEVDIVGAAVPLAKYSSLVADLKDTPSWTAEAFIIASSGCPDPVLVDVTRSVQTGSLELSWLLATNLPGFKPPAKPHKKQIRTAAEAVLSAKAPVLYVGGGVTRASASQDLIRLVDATNAPVVTALTARGTLPDSDQRNLGAPEVHGTVPVVGALQRADLAIVLGARFDDRVTGRLDSFATGAKAVHVDIDAAEISKNRYADVPVVDGLTEAIPALITEITTLKEKRKSADILQWWVYLERLKEEYPLGWSVPEDGMMAPQEVLEKLSKTVGPEAIYIMGVGQHQIWATQFIPYEEPRHLLSSCGLGIMGYCIPATMGAKVVRPDTVVWAIDGDGFFQMTNQEFATCPINRIPIKAYLINSFVLGTVYQWQNLSYRQCYSHTALNPDEGEQIPNSEMPAAAYGMAARTVCSIDEVDEAIEWVMSINDRPVLTDLRVSRELMVQSMVAAGVLNDEICYARDMAPDRDLED